MGVVGCAFGITINLDSVQELCLWIMRFPGRLRGLVAVGVLAVIWAI